MNRNLIEKIRKISGFEDKEMFRGAFEVAPVGKRASRPLKQFKPKNNKVMPLEKATICKFFKSCTGCVAALS